VLLNLRRADEVTDVVVRHGALVALTLGDGAPEVAANDWVDVAGVRDYAGLIVGRDGDTTELDGRLAGYTAAPNGHRQLLLAGADGLAWYDVAARPSFHVSLTAAADGLLSGRVDGASGGKVELYREQPGRPRVLIATAPLAADGSFSGRDAVPHSPTLYRAVYRDAASGLPYASLMRTPVG
jgi:hypothetical protein